MISYFTHLMGLMSDQLLKWLPFSYEVTIASCSQIAIAFLECLDHASVQQLVAGLAPSYSYTYVLHIYTPNHNYSYNIANQFKPGAIMLFKLPIMILSNAPKFSPLQLAICPNYTPLYHIMFHIYNFIKVLLQISLFLLDCYYMQAIQLQNYLRFVKSSDCSIRVYRSVPTEFMGFVFIKMLAKLLY